MTYVRARPVPAADQRDFDPRVRPPRRAGHSRDSRASRACADQDGLNFLQPLCTRSDPLCIAGRRRRVLCVDDDYDSAGVLTDKLSVIVPDEGNVCLSKT